MHLLNNLSHQDYSDIKQLLATIAINTNSKQYITVFFEMFLRNRQYDLALWSKCTLLSTKIRWAWHKSWYCNNKYQHSITHRSKCKKITSPYILIIYFEFILIIYFENVLVSSVDCCKHKVPLFVPIYCGVPSMAKGVYTIS